MDHPGPQKKWPKTLQDYFCSLGDTCDESLNEMPESGTEAKQPAKSAAVSVSGNIITATATSGGTTYLTCNPIVIVMRS